MPPARITGRSREAIVLAGGYGTRLASIVQNTCKPMAPVAGEPFLRRVLDQLDAAGFARVVIADGYRREQIEEYFMGTYRGLEVDYSSEDSPLLTGGAVKKALTVCELPEVFVLNGDTWLDVDFTAMEAALREHPEAECCIAAKRMRAFDRFGILDVENDGIIRSFREKASCDEGVINGGVYLVRRNALEGSPKVFSLENDWFREVVREEKLIACEAEGDFIDIGVPQDYERAQSLFARKGKTCKLAMFDRDGTINVDVGHLHCVKDLKFVPSTLEIMRQYSDDFEWSIAVITNQGGVAKGMYSLFDMRALHRVMAAELEKRGVRVDAWYSCPHHPDFTGECDCRKPKPGMLVRAMRDFRANRAGSVIYGDSDKDRLAAEACGVRFVEVLVDDNLAASNNQRARG